MPCLIFFFFLNCYLAVPRPTLGHSQGESLTNPMLITAFLHVQPEGHREPCSKVGSLSPAERLVGFELGTVRFLLQRLNPLDHSPHSLSGVKIMAKYREEQLFFMLAVKFPVLTEYYNK